MQHPQTLSLPEPDSPSREHSARVAAYIHHCLYAPGLGYYSAGTTKFGEAGDFVTAPEVSTVFGSVLADQCAELMPQIASPAILEIGAGSGKLAVDVMRGLAASDATPENGYLILEVSADLRERQEARLRSEVPELASQVTWLDQLPRDFSGIVLANEVLDALPVERFIRYENNIAQVCVSSDGNTFSLAERDAPDALVNAVSQIEDSIGRCCRRDTRQRFASPRRTGYPTSPIRFAKDSCSCSITVSAVVNIMALSVRAAGCAAISGITRTTIR